jgi:hypothetical protein
MTPRPSDSGCPKPFVHVASRPVSVPKTHPSHPHQRDGAAKNLWAGKSWRMWVTQSPFANEKPFSCFDFLRKKNEWSPGARRLGSHSRSSSTQSVARSIQRFELFDECSEPRGDGSCDSVVLVLEALPNCRQRDASITSLRDSTSGVPPRKGGIQRNVVVARPKTAWKPDR